MTHVFGGCLREGSDDAVMLADEAQWETCLRDELLNSLEVRYWLKDWIQLPQHKHNYLYLWVRIQFTANVEFITALLSFQ